jgi:hypothetical protein
MNILPPAIALYGDIRRAILLKSQGMAFYNMLAQQLKITGANRLTRHFRLPGGHVIDIVMMKNSNYDNYSGRISLFSPVLAIAIVPTSGSLMFTIYDNTDHLWYALNENTLTIETLVPAKYHIGYEARDFGSAGITQSKGAVGLWGIHTTVDQIGAYTVNLCTSRYATDNVEYLDLYPTLAGNHSYNDSTFTYNFGLSILYSGVQYAINVQSAVIIVDGTSSTLSMPKGLTSSSLNDISVCIGNTDISLDPIFTGRYAIGSFYPSGMYPVRNRHLGFAATSLDIHTLTLVPPTGSNTKGTVTINNSYNYSSSSLGLSVAHLIQFACLSREGSKVLTNSSGDNSKSYLVTATVLKINTDLFARKMVIYKYDMSSLGTIGSKVSLLEFDLTEKDMSFYTAYTGAPMYNRYKSSVLGGFELLKASDTFCFIKKEQTYTSDTALTTLGSHDNILEEDVKLIKIDMISGIATEKLLFSTQIIERTDVQSTSPFTMVKYLVSGGQVATDLLYADFENEVFAFGAIDLVTRDCFLVSTGFPTLPANNGSCKTSVWQYSDNVLSTVSTRSDNVQIVIQSTPNPSPPSASSNIWNPWSLWSSFESTSINSGAIQGERKTYATKGLGTAITGLFSDHRMGNVLGTGLTTKEYLVNLNKDFIEVSSHFGGYTYTPYLVSSDDIQVV